jgi:hypothetical protein
VSFLDRAPWHGYDAPGLRESSFCARRKPLRSHPRLRASNFCLRLSILTRPAQLGYDGTLRSLFALYREHPASPWHRLGRSARLSFTALIRTPLPGSMAIIVSRG